jgi:hypothetical protein
VAAIVTPAGGGAARAFVKTWGFATGSGGGSVTGAACPAPTVPSTPAGGGGTTTPSGGGSTTTTTSSAARKVIIALPSGRGVSRINIGVEAAAVGHAAKVRVRLVRRVCHRRKGHKHRTCAYRQVGHSKTTSIKRLGTHVTVRLPRRKKGTLAEVRFTVFSFRAGDGTSFATTTVVRHYR